VNDAAPGFQHMWVVNVSGSSSTTAPRRSGTGSSGHDRVTALLIAAVAILVVALVGPTGNFPLSDDWAYAFTTRSLCETGRIDLLPWTGASLVFQAAYGALLCKIFGLSFTVLRISTLLIAAAGVMGLRGLLAELGVRPAAAALALVVCGLSPLYVNLSFTFMSDVPFTALAVWAGCFYARGLREQRAGSLLWASVLCAAALLVRQHGIFLAAAAGLTALLDPRRSLGARLGAATVACTAPAVALGAYLVWLYAFHGAPPAVGNKLSEIVHASPLGLANITFRAAEYLGLLLIPLAAAALPSVARRARVAFVVALALLSTGVLVLYVREDAAMFYLTNVLYDLGLGALTLRDVLFLGLPAPEHIGVPLRIALTAASTISAATLVAAFRLSYPSRTQPARMFTASAAVLLFLGSLLHAGFYFDRYLLPILPFVAAVLVTEKSDLRVGAVAWGLALALAWYAVAGTHDYMAWNRARFDMLSELESAGTDPRAIDGGVEYNAWRLAHDLGTWPTTEEARPGQPASKRSWWWVVDDRYVVTFRSLEGYALKARRQYQRWLVPGHGRVLLLERAESPPA